jgi:hypothetical protein
MDPTTVAGCLRSGTAEDTFVLTATAPDAAKPRPTTTEDTERPAASSVVERF